MYAVRLISGLIGKDLIDSLVPVMILLCQHFGAMKLKDQSVMLGVTATEAEMSSEHSNFIESSLESGSPRMF